MTDSAPDDARSLLEHFERAHSVLGSVAFPYEPRLALQTDVVLLARESSTDFLLENTRGVFLEYAREYFGDPVLYLAGAQAFEEIREVGVHELTHRFAHFHIPSAPRWLDEGLAQYYQTMEFHSDRVTIGKSLLTSFQRNNQGSTVRFGMAPEETVPLARLRGMTPEGFYDGDKGLHYLSSWAFVHVLQAGPRRETFSAYRDALYRADVDEKVAFERTFGHESEETLLEEARSLLGSELLEVELVSRQFAWPSNSPARERVPSPSEVRCLLARSLLATDRGQDVDEHIAEALSLDPKNPEAHLLRGFSALRRGDLTVALPAFERAYEIAPVARYASAYLRALLEVVVTTADGQATTDPRLESKKKELASALLRLETSSEHDVVLADYLQRAGRVGNAEKYVSRAIEKDPGNPDAYRVLALVRERQTRLEDALEAASFAARLSPHGQLAPATQELLARLCKATGGRKGECRSGASSRAPSAR